MKEFFTDAWSFIVDNRTLLIIGLGLIALLVVAICALACYLKSKKTVPAQTDEQSATEELTASDGKIAEPAVEIELEEEQSLAQEETVSEEPVEEDIAPVVKKTTRKPTAKKTPEKAKKLTGKWVIEFKAEKEYLSKLLASNGEVMLTSEIYSTEDGARQGIATIISSIENGNFIVYENKSGNYYYKLKTANNRLLCVGEIYNTKDQCLKAVESVKRFASVSAITDGVIKGERYIDYKPEKVTSYEAKKGSAGKWKVEITNDGKYSAKLYASNGHLMLATEEVSSKKGAETAIEAVKKNSIAGNFIIDKDKSGRFYYKLRNAQKSVICIGEAYESLDSCINALESVRRYANTAVYARTVE